jgi:hypothetical protein
VACPRYSASSSGSAVGATRELVDGCVRDTYSHAEGAAKVIEDDPRAGVARVIHGGV